MNYWETYSPVVKWPVIRFLLTHALINHWSFRQIDYELAYTQASPETDMYMKTPKGFTISGGDANDFVLKIKKNYYGQKQAGRVWNKYLHNRLIQAGFEQSQYEECVYFHNTGAIYLLYVDDSILMGPNETDLHKIVEQLRTAGLGLTTEEGLADFLGVDIDRHEDGSLHMTQPRLIRDILKDLNLQSPNVKPKALPHLVTRIIQRYADALPFDHSFHYRRVVGKLNFLQASTRPEIAYAVHQCARYSQDPKQPHGNAIRLIARYLAGTQQEGLILSPNKTQGFQVYADADFCGNYKRGILDPNNARSRTGFVIRYAGCPIYWKTKLQSEIALSTTEAEVISLSMALRAAIPLIHLSSEMIKRGFPVHSATPCVHCRLFEDNSAAIEIATTDKVRPRTKYLNVKWFHFRSYVEDGTISIHPIQTGLQQADMFTKPLPQDAFTSTGIVSASTDGDQNRVNKSTTTVSFTVDVSNSTLTLYTTPSLPNPNPNL